MYTFHSSVPSTSSFTLSVKHRFRHGSLVKALVPLSFPPSLLPSFPSGSRREVETDPDSGFETSGCSQSQINDYNSAAQCGALSDSNGPFVACHATLSPESFQEWVLCVCVWELCTSVSMLLTPLSKLSLYCIVCVSLSDCVFDLCAEQGSAALRCASYEAYAAACQEAGIKLGSWRQQLDCGRLSNHYKPSD